MSKLSRYDNVDIKKMSSVCKLSNISKVSKVLGNMRKVIRCHASNSSKLRNISKLSSGHNIDATS